MAWTRDRFEFSCSPTITTALYLVSAKGTEEIVDMNTVSEVKDNTEVLEANNTEATLEKSRIILKIWKPIVLRRTSRMILKSHRQRLRV